MKSCANIRDNICAYIDDELDINERLSFEEHVKNCTECKKELDEMSRIVALCTSLPQQELPADFRAELHEKLLAVSKRQGNGEDIKRVSKGFRFIKYFAPVAAALLLIFLVGNYYRFGIFSSMKAGSAQDNKVTMAAEKLQEAPEAGSAQGSVDNNAAVTSDSADEVIKGFGAYGTDGESAGTHRSTDSEHIFAALGNESEAETASRRVSTITITLDEPDTQIEKINELALENNGEPGTIEVAFADTAGGTGAPDKEEKETQAQTTTYALASSRQQLKYIIPVTNYDQFVSALNNTFGPANIQQGAYVTEDLTEVLNKSINESNELDMRIREIEESSDKKSEELEILKEKKQATDDNIEKMRLGSDFVNITIYIDTRK